MHAGVIRNEELGTGGHCMHSDKMTQSDHGSIFQLLPYLTIQRKIVSIRVPSNPVCLQHKKRSNQYSLITMNRCEANRTVWLFTGHIGWTSTNTSIFIHMNWVRRVVCHYMILGKLIQFSISPLFQLVH